MEDHRRVIVFSGNKENGQPHAALLKAFLVIMGTCALLFPTLSFAQTTYINKPGAPPSPCFGNTTTPPPPPPGPTTPPGVNPFTTYIWIQAETRTEQKNIVTSASDITDLDRGDYALYPQVNFGAQGARTFIVRLGAPTTNQNNIIEIRLDSPQSTPVARLSPVATGGWGTLAYQANATYSLISGVHDVYLTFQGSEVAAIDAFGFERTTPATGLNPLATKPTTLTLINLPPLATTETKASISYAKVLPASPDVVHCRLDTAAPAVCPNPFVIGATTPLAIGQHKVDYYIDSGYGIDPTKPFMSYAWTIYTPFVVPPPPPPPGGTGSCASGPITIPQSDPDPAGCTCVNNPTPPPTTPPPPGGAPTPPSLPACSGSTAVLRHVSAFDTYNPPPTSPLANQWQTSYSYGTNSWLSGLSMAVEPTGRLTHSTAISRQGGGAVLVEAGTQKFDAAKQIGVGGGYRSEMLIQHDGIAYPWDDGKSYWVAFSLNPIDVSPVGAYSYFQVHHPSWAPNPTTGLTSDALMLRPITKYGLPYYEFRVVDGATVDTNGGATKGTKPKWEAPIMLNQWTDFVINFTLSSKGQGYIHLWVNGKQVYTQTGMTNVQHFDAAGNELPLRKSNPAQVGLYGPDDNAADPLNKVYLDEFREAVGCSGYSLVDPSKGGNGTPTSVPTKTCTARSTP